MAFRRGWRLGWRWCRRWSPVLVLGALGLALTLGLFQLVRERQRSLTRARFEVLATGQVARLEAEVRRNTGALESMATLFLASEQVTPDEFETFAARWLARPGVKALMWMPRETVDGEVVYPVQGVVSNEPEIGQALLEEPLLENPVVARAAEQARQRGGPVATPPLNLFPERADGVLTIFLHPLPARRPSGTPAHDPSREALRGLIAGVFDFSETVRASLPRVYRTELQLVIRDRTSGQPERIIYPLPPPGEAVEAPPAGAGWYEQELMVANRRWLVSALPVEVFLARRSSWVPLGVLLAGLTITLLLMSSTGLLLNRERHIAQEVRQRTAQLEQTRNNLEQQIAQRQRYENALRESEARFRAAFNQAAVGIALVDLEGRFVQTNERFCQIVGRSAEQLRGTRFLDLTHPDDRSSNERNFLQTAAGEIDRYSLEKRYLRPDGKTIWTRVTASPVRDATGTPRYSLGVVEDITQRKRAEEALARQHAVLERRASQLRDLTAELTDAEQRERRRLAQHLHDHLQQLLVAIKMRLGQLCPRGDERAGEAAEQISRLLDESIEASRTLTAELAPPVLYSAGLTPALEWLGRWMRDRHGLTVHVDADPDAEPSGESLRTMLFGGVRELLFNVIKHAGTNEAWVRVSRSGQRRTQIVVEDRGAGIDPQRVLADASGGGFGLFSLRERLEALGGRMTVESGAGEGTRVTLVAPLRPAEAQAELETAGPGPARQPQADDNPRIRVLLADDHQVVREGLANLLRSQPDIEIVGEAADGAEALDQARRLQPDVVVMDVSMPRLSGIEATRRVRQELPDTQVVGLSFHEEPEIAREMREAGAASYLTKGGPAEDLLSAVRSACEAGRPS
ncbi:MAG: PAS domain S-box protein [Phycisphaeraceae bacterium]